MGNSAWPAAIVAGIVIVHLVLYAFPRFSYEIVDARLRVRRYILGRMAFGRWEINLSEVREARRSLMKIPVMAKKLGSLYSPLKGVVLTSRRRGLLLQRSFYVTPEDPEEFIRRVNGITGARTATEEGRGSAERERPGAPLWLSDMIAALSGLVAWVALTPARFLAGIPQQHHLFGPPPGSRALDVAAVALAVLMSVWMIVDCFVQLKRTAERRFLAWLAGMFLFFPTCWFYYLVQKRPRRLRLASEAAKNTMKRTG